MTRGRKKIDYKKKCKELEEAFDELYDEVQILRHGIADAYVAMERLRG